MNKKDLKEERMKILGLLSDGIITPDQAEKLLNALNAGDEVESIVESPKKKSQFRMLKILVDSHEGDKVRMELPIEFAKLLKSKKFKLDSIDEFDMDVDELIDMINAGVVGEIVNVTSSEGDRVKIIVE